MKYQAHQVYHVFNQGNNRQTIFFERENYLFFLRKMRTHLHPYADILCYCLMPNHFHWLIVPKVAGLELSKGIKPRGKFENTQIAGTSKVPAISSSLDQQQVLSHQIGVLLSGYTKAINKRYERSGSLFRARTKSKDGWIGEPITSTGKNKELLFQHDNDYALRCFHYIHENPVKANLVTQATDWEFSSAKDYAKLRKGTLCNYTLAKTVFG